MIFAQSNPQKDTLMTAEADKVKLFAYFNQLSDMHNKEILEKAEELASLELASLELAKLEQEKKEEGKASDDEDGR
jgi:hypothetical protein